MKKHEDIAIQIQGLRKRYILGEYNYKSLKKEIQSRFAKLRGKEDPNRKIGWIAPASNDFYALDGIDLTVHKGETLGIIGANGAGKSTLLKLISRITTPTEGIIGINGRISSMLEVGAGFVGEMTGRENIFLNGAILGMKYVEIEKKLDDIIEFSECKEFIDTPLKRYSSGMYVKLAFSVAAHLNNDIMIMDEVLAVGDIHFQKKCIEKMAQISSDEGKTILYVSHNMSTIRQLCRRCIVLSAGKKVFDGNTEEAIAYYSKEFTTMKQDADVSEIPRSKKVSHRESLRIQRISLADRLAPIYHYGEKLTLVLVWKTNVDISDVALGVVVQNSDATPIGVAYGDIKLSAKKGQMIHTTLTIATESLAIGSFLLGFEMWEQSRGRNPYLADALESCFAFEMTDTPQQNHRIFSSWQRNLHGSLLFSPIKTRSIIEDVHMQEES